MSKTPSAKYCRVCGMAAIRTSYCDDLCRAHAAERFPEFRPEETAATAPDPGQYVSRRQWLESLPAEERAKYENRSKA